MGFGLFFISTSLILCKDQRRVRGRRHGAVFRKGGAVHYPALALERLRDEEARKAKQVRERKEKERERRVQPYAVPAKGGAPRE